MPRPNLPQTPMIEQTTGRATQAWHRFFTDITNFPRIAYDPKQPKPGNPTGFLIVNLNNTDFYVPFYSAPYGET